MSRRPDPTRVKELRGTVRPSRVRPDEPKPEPPVDAFEAVPELLAENPVAAAEWRRLAPVLVRARVVTEADRAGLLAMCMEWATYVRAVEEADKCNLVATRGNGGTGLSPYVVTARGALTNLRALWSEFGLTPSSRTRVAEVPFRPDDDPFREFDDDAPTTNARRH